MSDLIDRQAAITAICEDGTWLESQGCTEITMCERKQRDADILSELPPVDAVPVVRCKDCEFFSEPNFFSGKCTLRGDYIFTNDFCSYAVERRTDA